MFLFPRQHEELVGIYASQLARHHCIDLFVHMMELRLNGRSFFNPEVAFISLEFFPSTSYFFRFGLLFFLVGDKIFFIFWP